MLCRFRPRFQLNRGLPERSPDRPFLRRHLSEYGVPVFLHQLSPETLHSLPLQSPTYNHHTLHKTQGPFKPLLANQLNRQLPQMHLIQLPFKPHLRQCHQLHCRQTHRHLMHLRPIRLPHQISHQPPRHSVLILSGKLHVVPTQHFPVAPPSVGSIHHLGTGPWVTHPT